MKIKLSNNQKFVLNIGCYGDKFLVREIEMCVNDNKIFLNGVIVNLKNKIFKENQRIVSFIDLDVII